MNSLTDLTFLIPIRIDFPEREENLTTVLHSLYTSTHTNIIILEADKIPLYRVRIADPRISYVFIQDNDPVFHRTKYLNILLQKTETPYAGIWDSDVLISNNQIEKGVEVLRKGKTIFCFPYDGHFYGMDELFSREFRQTNNFNFLLKNKHHFHLMYGCNAVGGAFLVHREMYLNCGGENEHFYGWGPEDSERVKRMEILEYTPYRIDGPLYHLYHPRGRNSFFFDEQKELSNRKELLKICSMDKATLLNYIQSW